MVVDIIYEIEVRRERARHELRKYVIQPSQVRGLLCLYNVCSASGHTYDVEIRNPFALQNRCSCPDYEQNSLGTCKHIEGVILWLEQACPDEMRALRNLGDLARADQVSLLLGYDEATFVQAYPSKTLSPAVKKVVKRYFERDGRLCEEWAQPQQLTPTLEALQQELTAAGGLADIAPEVWAFAREQARRSEMRAQLDRLLAQVKAGALGVDVLKLPLYPYQMLGVLFLALTERALLADDMGLGKTIQAIAAAVFLKRQGKLSRILVVCPASVKLQWAKEIQRFSHETVTVIGGTKARRMKQYDAGSTFTVLNYELLLRDFAAISALQPNLMILDEAQRIKNWRAQTTQLIKQLSSDYAYVLTGTPVENKLDELYSIVQFLDRRLLGPAWKFMAEHVIRDEFGAIIGYRKLDVIKHKIAPIFLRRRKAEVLPDLPERIDHYRRVPFTSEQARLYRAAESELRAFLAIPREEWTPQIVGRVLALITELREICDAAQLAAPYVNASAKLEELVQLVQELTVEDEHKLLIFSEWERMAHLVETGIASLPVQAVHLHGGLSLKQRQRVIEEFSNNPRCRVFISTDAGGLGLNLQAADVVINVELPWNPARLEQRIGRAHRLGQRNAVNVINLMIEDSIEERVLEIIYEKRELFTTLFDTDIAEINLSAQGRVEQLHDLVARLLERPR